MINELAAKYNLHFSSAFDFNEAVVRLYTNSDCQPFKGLYDECMVKMDMVNVEAQQKLGAGDFISTQKEMDEAEEELKKSYEFAKDKVKQLRDKKLEEIDEAYYRQKNTLPGDNNTFSEGFDVTRSMRIDS